MDVKLNLDTFGLSCLKETDSQCEDDQGMRNQERRLSDKLTVLINDVDITMKNLGYATYRGNIYKKIEESHYTFAFKCEPRAFVNTLATNETFKARLLKDMRKVIDILSDPYCEVIRPLVINYDLIEVNNSTYWSIKHRKFVECSIPASKIGQISPRAYCKYDPSKDPDPKYFKEILDNSLSDEEQAMFCEDFLKLLNYNKKKHKDKVPCLVGDTNSGKSSLFFPILGLIHHGNVATITKQRAFNKSMITKFTEVIFIDEATESMMTNDDWKTLTQGGFAAYDVKYETAKSFINRSPMLITAQHRLKFGADDQPAMDHRLTTYHFKSLPSPKKRAASWLRKNPMECVVWAATKARPIYEDEEEEQEEAEESEPEEGILNETEKEALRAFCIVESPRNTSANNIDSSDDGEDTDRAQDSETATDDERIIAVKKVLHSNVKGSLRYRQAKEMLNNEQKRKNEKEKHYRTKQAIYKEKGVSSQNLHLVPRDSASPVPEPIVNELRLFSDIQRETRAKERKDQCRKAFENAWVRDTEIKFYEVVNKYHDETRDRQTRDGAKGLIDIYSNKLKLHHVSLGTWNMKEALEERRNTCILLGLLSKDNRQSIQSLSDPLPIKEMSQKESEENDDDIFLTPCPSKTNQSTSDVAEKEEEECALSQDFLIHRRQKRKNEMKTKGSEIKKRSILNYFTNIFTTK
jgi:hypothetical protein